MEVRYIQGQLYNFLAVYSSVVHLEKFLVGMSQFAYSYILTRILMCTLEMLVSRTIPLIIRGSSPKK